MALTDIYVLPSNYAKFDWSDWPDSAAALVSGGYTHEFEKECWNAIVDLLARALTDAGLTWDSTYTTHAAARITEEYGDLYAKTINSVRHNIDTAVPAKLRWGWANDPTFRGYIGRKDFRGVDAYGENGADDVYPEYIVELAARLNYMISVATGEAAKVLQGSGVAETLNRAKLLEKQPRLLVGSGQGYSLHDATVRARRSRALASGQIIYSIYDATLNRGRAARMAHEYILGSNYKANPEKLYVKNLGRYEYILTSKYLAEMDIYNVCPISAKLLERSLSDGELARLQPKLLTSFGLDKTLCAATVSPVQGLQLSGEKLSASRYNAEIAPVETHPVTAQSKAATLTAAVPAKLGIAAMGAGEKAASINSAEIGPANDIGRIECASKTSTTTKLRSAWYPPVLVDGGLWIRQSHGVTQNKNGELVIT